MKDMTHVMHRLGHLPQFASPVMMGGKAIHCGRPDGKPDEMKRGCDLDKRRWQHSQPQPQPPYQEEEEEVEFTAVGRDQRRRRLAPYHPGPGAHAFQGEALAFSHLGVLLEGLDQLLAAIREAAAAADYSTDTEDFLNMVPNAGGGGGLRGGADVLAAAAVAAAGKLGAGASLGPSVP